MHLETNYKIVRINIKFLFQRHNHKMTTNNECDRERFVIQFLVIKFLKTNKQNYTFEKKANVVHIYGE